MNSIPRTAIIALMVSVSFSAIAFGGYIKRGLPPEVKGDVIGRVHAVYITNAASQSMRFLLSYKGEDWDSHTLDEGDGDTFYHEQEEENGIHIRVQTSNKGEVKYRLNDTKRYAIAWNGQRKQWDVFLVESR